MNTKRSQWVLKAGGLAVTMGAGVLIGRISMPDETSATASNDGSERGSQTGGPGGLSLVERMQQRKRPGEDRDSAKADKDLQSVLEVTSRLDRTQRLLAFLERLPADQFAGVYEELRNSPSANLQGSERSLVLQAWADRDPLGAVAFLQESGGGDGERETALSTWAAKDPQGAFAWASTAADEGDVNNWLLGATRGIAAADPLLARDYLSQLEGRTLNEAVDEVGPYVTQLGFEYTSSWIAGLGDEELRNRASSEMAGDIARLDPAQAAQWATAITDENTRRNVAEDVADQWARQDLTAARAWVDGLPDDSKLQAAEGVTRQYARQDPAAAAQWLAALGNNPQLDGARRAFIEESFRQSPETSLGFVASLSDRDRQQGYYQRYLGDWIRTDEAAARQWIDTNRQQIPRQVMERINRSQQ